MKESYLLYSMSVIVSRALPDVRDGLKPVQRRILYAMRELNLAPGSRFAKCAAEVGAALVHFIDNPNSTAEELMEFILGPDFPTAGMILGTKGIRDAYTTGRGSVVMQAKYHIEPMDNGKNAIIVSELPYQANKAR